MFTISVNFFRFDIFLFSYGSVVLSLQSAQNISSTVSNWPAQSYSEIWEKNKLLMQNQKMSIWYWIIFSDLYIFFLCFLVIKKHFRNICITPGLNPSSFQRIGTFVSKPDRLFVINIFSKILCITNIWWTGWDLYKTEKCKRSPSCHISWSPTLTEHKIHVQTLSIKCILQTNDKQ